MAQLEIYKSKFDEAEREQFNNVDSLKYFHGCSLFSAKIWSKNKTDWAISTVPKKQTKIFFTSSKELYIRDILRVSEKSVLDISVF